MKRRLLSVLLAMMLASSCMLASCGEDSPEVPESKESSTETTLPAEQDKETASAETTPVVFTLQDAEGTPGGTVEVEVSIRAVSEINSVALHTLTYDKDILTFKGFADWEEFEENQCIFPHGFDEEKEIIILALKDLPSIDSDICKIVFEIDKDATAGTTSVEMSSIVKFDSEVIESSVNQAMITIGTK